MFGATLILIGTCGVLCRRNLLSIILSFHIVMLGITWLITAEQVILILLITFSLIVIVASGAAIFVYRHCGTLAVDELRQLRG